MKTKKTISNQSAVKNYESFKIEHTLVCLSNGQPRNQEYDDIVEY